MNTRALFARDCRNILTAYAERKIGNTEREDLLHNGDTKIFGDGDDLTLISGFGGQDISINFHNKALEWFNQPREMVNA